MPFLIQGRSLCVRKWLTVGLLVGLVGTVVLSSGMTPTTAAFELPANGVSAGSSLDQVAFFPLIFKDRAPDPPATFFGVQMYGLQLHDDNSLGLARLARVSWVRFPISWAQVEPQNVDPDQFTWTAADNAITEAALSGHRLIATIVGNPSWAATYAQGPIDQTEISEFAEFVEELVERYDGDGYRDAPGSPVVNHWEFYNEPDGDNRWAAAQGVGAYWGRYGVEYAEMLCAANHAAKMSNLNSKVVFGGLAYDLFTDQGGSFHREFLDDVLGAGGGLCFDVMNFHYYPSFESHWVAYGYGIIGKATFLRQKLQSYGVSKPFVVTESGWYSNQSSSGPGSPEIQARYVVKLFAQAAAANLQSMVWFSWVDPGDPYEAFGLLDESGNPKLSFEVYQVAAEKIGLSQFGQICATGSYVEGYQFVDSLGKPLYIFWSRDELMRSVSVPGRQVRVLNMQGELIRTARDGDDGLLNGWVPVAVDANPIYVELEW